MGSPQDTEQNIAPEELAQEEAKLREEREANVKALKVRTWVEGSWPCAITRPG